MPWKEISPMDERKRFVEAALRSDVPITELCKVFGISRKTGYKWLSRFKAWGLPGLGNRSRAPSRRPRATSSETEQLLVKARKAHPRWGSRKIRHWLAKRLPAKEWPAPSTITAVFHRHGLITEQKHSRGFEAGSQVPPLADQSPNETWCTDYKGHFRTRSGPRVYPLTISDACSRFLLALQDAEHESNAATQKVMEPVFREFGLPERMRMDNGHPFGSSGLYGLTGLIVWLIKLGIQIERIKPASPQQNGRHERIHRTIKLETALPPAATPQEQQRRFDAFRRCYNEERPHEALGMRTPAELYKPSTRPFPSRIEQPVYPAYFEVRRVQRGGEIRWAGSHIFIAEALHDEHVGLEPIDDGWWVIRFSNCRLALLDETGPKRTVVPLPYRVTSAPQPAGPAKDVPEARALTGKR